MKYNHELRRMAVVVAGSMLFGATHMAMADTTDDLLKKLHDKGVLTDEEYDQFNVGRDKEKVKKSSEIKASFKDGIVWTSGDGQHSMQVVGRVQLDYHNISGYGKQNDPDTTTIADNFEIRRARIGVKGRFYNDYSYEIQTNIVGNNANLVDQAWVNIGWWKQAQLKFGRYKAPFNMEKQTSANYTDFNERSYVYQLAPGDVLGAMLWGEPMDGVIYQANVFQKDFSENDNATNDLFIGGRVAANIARIAGWNNAVLHVGVSGYDGEYALKPTTSSQNSSSATTRSTILSFRSEGRGLSNIFRAQISGNNALATPGGSASNDASIDQRAFGVELAGAYGPFKLQGEYARAHFDASFECTLTTAAGSDCLAAEQTASMAKINGDVTTWYAEALWLLTGENYADSYKDGAWGAIRPKNEFVHPSAISAGNYGAWELGLRYSEYDASDLRVDTAGRGSRIQGSPQGHAYTGGIKWILNPNLRFLLDYTRTKYDTALAPIDTSLAKTDHENALTLRGQINF